MQIKGHRIQAISRVGMPANLAITTYSNTSITVSWTARTEPLIAYYSVYYSTSQNGTYTKATLSNNVTTNSYQITGLTQGQTYYVKVAAVDTSGNIGPFSNIVSQALTAFTVPSISFTNGSSANHNLSQYYTIPPGESFVSLTLVQGNLNSGTTGITLNSGAQQFQFNGTGSPSTLTSFILRLTTSSGTINSTTFNIVINAAAQLTWSQNFPNPIPLPQSGSFNFAPYYTDPSGELASIAVNKTLPSGVTIATNPHRLVAASNATIQTADGYSFTLIKNPEADWASRSTAEGVFYANNLTYRNAAKTQLINSSAEMRSSFYPSGGTQSFAVWDTTNKVSGAGSLRVNLPAASPGAYAGLGLSFDGIGLTTKANIKHEFYFQFAFYADSVYHGFYYGSRQVWGAKIAIIATFNSSNQVGEVVLRRHATPGGYIHGYRLAADYEYWLHRYASLNDWATNNFYDASPGSTPSNTTDLQTKHGLNRNADNSTTAPAAVTASGVPRLVSNGWTTIGGYIKQPPEGSGYGGTVKWWMAPYGQPPVLFQGGINGRLPPIGAMDEANIDNTQLYTGIQLISYHNGNPPNWPSTDTYIAYDEIIVSDNPIPFPGGYSLPYPGQEIPPGYDTSREYF